MVGRKKPVKKISVKKKPIHEDETEWRGYRVTQGRWQNRMIFFGLLLQVLDVLVTCVLVIHVAHNMGVLSAVATKVQQQATQVGSVDVATQDEQR